jgi:hypothetical protein
MGGALEGEGAALSPGVLRHTFSSLIPVPVTGIQPRRVRAVYDCLFAENEKSCLPKALGRLDPRDILVLAGGGDEESLGGRRCLK